MQEQAVADQRHDQSWRLGSERAFDGGFGGKTRRERPQKAPNRVVDGSDEAVSPAWQGLNESRVVSGVIEGNPQFADGGIEAFIEADVGIGGPQSAPAILRG